MGELREECGVFGVWAPEKDNIASTIYYGLFALQHRGQEACGIVINDDGVFTHHKDVGLVNTVFTQDRLDSLGYGNMGIGHVRYCTTGSNGRENAQPIVVNHIKGNMALAHNGNLVNSSELRTELELKGSIFHTSSDTEIISYIITEERLSAPSIEEAVNRTMNRIEGAYSLVVMSPAKLIAVRDPRGMRPLCYGRTPDGRYIVASESCALETVGAKFVRDVDPGEIVIFDKNGIRSMRDHCESMKRSLCIFEYIYFARPDSVIDGKSVHMARFRAGEILSQEHPVEADIVIGSPDSGLDAAVGYASKSGIPYEIGLVKNKYIARTFIAPGQASREDKVRIKLNPIREVVNGKRVILVDDSIVRGTTSRRLIQSIREAGAKEIHMRIAAPPFINPCYYGVDIDSRENLIAVGHSIEEIRDFIGVDSLAYISIPGIKKAVTSFLDDEDRFCTACFDGNYPTEVPDETCSCKNKFERKISDSPKFKKEETK